MSDAALRHGWPCGCIGLQAQLLHQLHRVTNAGQEKEAALNVNTPFPPPTPYISAARCVKSFDFFAVMCVGIIHDFAESMRIEVV